MNKSSLAPRANRTKAPKASKTAPKAKKLSTKARKAAKKSVLTNSKRFGSIAVDAENRILPLDYQSASLHDPYAYFREETSTVFDEHPVRDFALHNYTDESFRAAARIQDNLLTLEIPKVRKTITCPKELEAFDKILVPVLQTRESDNIKSIEEVNYELEKQGLSIEKLEAEEKDWKELFTNDMKFASTGGKIRTYGYHALIWSSCLFLSYQGLEASNQFYYDLQYPIHGHHDH